MAVAAAALVDIPLHPLHLPLHHVHQLGQKAWLNQSGCLCLNNLWLPVPGWNRSVWVYLTFLFVVLTRIVKHIHFLENLSVDCSAAVYLRCCMLGSWHMRREHWAGSLRHHCLSLSPSLADLACKPSKAAILNHWGGHTVSDSCLSSVQSCQKEGCWPTKIDFITKNILIFCILMLLLLSKMIFFKSQIQLTWESAEIFWAPCHDVRLRMAHLGKGGTVIRTCASCAWHVLYLIFGF